MVFLFGGLITSRADQGDRINFEEGLFGVLFLVIGFIGSIIGVIWIGHSRDISLKLNGVLTPEQLVILKEYMML